MQNRFEALLMEGKNPNNPLHASLIHKAADGSYCNHQTQMSYLWFLRGATLTVETSAPVDFNQDVILQPPPREVTNIGWERPVRISFDGAEGEGRVWVHDDDNDEMIAVPGVDNARKLAGLLIAWANAYGGAK